MPRLLPSDALLSAFLALLALAAPSLAQDDAPSLDRGQSHFKPVKLPAIKPPTLAEDR